MRRLTSSWAVGSRGFYAILLIESAIYEHVVDRSISAATAQMARRAPRLGLSLSKRAANLEPFLRTAAQAHCTSVVLSQLPPGRMRLDRRLPALSSLRGTMQAHDMN